ncbi:MAG TPA: class I SAM-dependent methyltransferase [Pyrinomonadaceae bacterium]|nr:class I SAM-dependent methyltransferase [Pyrinomonadaceae bacterium]
MSIEEVHVWRGTPEQRALRAQAIKTHQFAYFDEQLDHPDWLGKLVLDFGGNRGNIFYDADCEIDPRNYYCVDVIKDAIEDGRKTFPDAHWAHYDRYNCSFNPGGIADLAIPDFGPNFDIILAYSVFTHTTLEEMHDLVAQLKKKLVRGGKLAFTFIDPHWQDNLKWRLEQVKQNDPAEDVEGLLVQSRNARWCSLVNGELFVESNGQWSNEAETCMTYHVFYTGDFMREQFPHAMIRPPVNDEMQHCCIITNDFR